MRSIQSIVRRFWAAYHRHYPLVLAATTAVFLLQVFHLYWLFTDVVLRKLLGHSFFVFPASGMFIYVIADYLEIPALLSTCLLYLYDLRQRVTLRTIGMLVLLNTQWIHLFWITDDVVVRRLGQQGLVAWPEAIAWFAILIDYLELPVVFDTCRRLFALRYKVLASLRAAIAGPSRGRARAGGTA